MGLPLALALAKTTRVIGYDLNRLRINDLNNKKDFNNEFTKELKTKNKKLIFTNNEKFLSKCNIFIITVPTPVKKNNSPDLTYLKIASQTVAKYIKKKLNIHIRVNSLPKLYRKFLCSNR